MKTAPEKLPPDPVRFGAPTARTAPASAAAWPKRSPPRAPGAVTFVCGLSALQAPPRAPKT